MARMTNARSGLTFDFAQGELGWGEAMNTNLETLARIGFHLTAKAIQSAPPTTQQRADTYIVSATGASGAWASFANMVVVWDGSSWQPFNPSVGIRLFVESSSSFMLFNGSAWEVTLNTGTIPKLSELVQALRVSDYDSASGGQLGAEDRRALDYLKLKLTGTASADALRTPHLTANGFYYDFDKNASGAASTVAADVRANKESFATSPFTLTGGQVLPDVRAYAGRGSGLLGQLKLATTSYNRDFLLCFRYQRSALDFTEDIIDLTTADLGQVMYSSSDGIYLYEAKTTNQAVKPNAPVKTTLSFPGHTELPFSTTQQTIQSSPLPAEFVNGTQIDVSIYDSHHVYGFVLQDASQSVFRSVIHREPVDGNRYWELSWSYNHTSRVITFYTISDDTLRTPFNAPFSAYYNQPTNITVPTPEVRTKICDFSAGDIVNLAVHIDRAKASKTVITASAGSGIASITYAAEIPITQLLLGATSGTSIIQSLFVGLPASGFDLKLLDSLALAWPTDGGAPENVINRSGSATSLSS